MASSWFLILAFKCLYHFAWPLVALVYPMCASVHAIETDSYAKTKDLISYWILLSLIYLFEYAFVNLLLWFQLWPYTKLMIIFWLIIPDFGRASYVYNKLIHSMKPQIVRWGLNSSWKKWFFEKDNFLMHAERYMKENGTEALEKLIASKNTMCRPDAEATNEISATDDKEMLKTNGERLQKEQKDIKGLEAIDKKVIPASKQDIPVMLKIRPSQNASSVTVETKGTAESERAGGEVPRSSTQKGVQREWTCAICLVTTSREKDLISHLNGRRHRVASEALIAKKQPTQQKQKDAEATTNKTIATDNKKIPKKNGERFQTENNNIKYLEAIDKKEIPATKQRSSGHHGEQRWKEKPKTEPQVSAIGDAETVTNKLSAVHIGENSVQTKVQNANEVANSHGSTAIWKPKSYGTVSGGANVTEVESTPVSKAKVDGLGGVSVASTQKSSSGSAALSKLFSGNLLENFTVDSSTYAQARIRATFYPKFENEKSDQETRSRMIELVSKGLVTLEVSLKHSGSLFMYAGHKGGAYAKNSFGNIYTAVGVFVLGRMFREAWGTEASKKQAEFNDFLEENHMCISMELVTAVLGDHGQRPLEDYVVVTAVTELGNGKPKFYSTPEIIAFCRKWRLPTNHVWLFSTRKSASSFFAAYDALCEEGTATSVCKTLDEIADVSVPGSKDHVKAQGEILEGLVARLVNHESSKQIEKILKEFPPPPADGVALDFGSSLREICAANRSDEKQQMKALLEGVGSSFCPDYADWFGTDAADIHSRNADKSVLSKFLQAHPADYSTKKLQELVRLVREKRYPAAFKCYHNFHRVDAISNDDLFYKMVIHVHSDSTFRRYQKEMRNRPGLWPLYRGFFVDINLFKADKEKVAEISKNSVDESGSSGPEKDDFADEDANLMVKLKFLTYKLRTFLIRNGLSVLFKEGPGAYKAYYLRQMKIWGTSPGKQKELSKMLDEWAVYIRRKCGNKQLSSSIYLSEAEPFLEQFAKRSPQNQALIGSAGSLVRTEDFLAIVEGGQDEEGDLASERDIAPSEPNISVKDTVPKDEGMIVFFPGIPGCAKSALCKELLNAQGGLLGDDRPVHSLMGDLIKGKYWQKVAEERKKKPKSIMLADKNAPNEEVWRQIEDMCRKTRASAVPVVPESEGTDSNPFSLDALAVFVYRVLQRVNHPGNLDKASPNAGYVLLMFYHLYDGKSRKEFEGELIDRFGSLVKMPLLQNDRNPLPEAVQCILEEGIDLYKLHTKRHGRLDSTKGTYAKEWMKWEKQLRDILFANADYFNSVQVPFEFAVKQVLEQLRNIAKGDYTPPDTEKRTFGTIAFAALSIPVIEIQGVLNNLAKNNPKIDEFLKEKSLEKLNRAHLTLAHKRSHGIKAVAEYGLWLHKKAPVELTALLFSDKMAAFEAFPGSVEGEKIVPKNAFPHITLWTSKGVSAKDANMLPQLFAEGKANRIDFNPPINVSGTVEFY